MSDSVRGCVQATEYTRIAVPYLLALTLSLIL